MFFKVGKFSSSRRLLVIRSDVPVALRSRRWTTTVVESLPEGMGGSPL